jgi:ribosomal protein S18 acetylase RimI-like enzyme
MDIKRFDEVDDRLGEFINKEFSAYGEQNGVVLNYDEFCIAAEEDSKILGVITGRAYYNEVHIGDLIVASSVRKGGIGSKLVRAVEDNYRGNGYDKITLTTFGFQAPEFYKKLGYEIEFVREDKEPKLSKYFLAKQL